ncbi:MAG TPA: PD-(D/E)XK nuclease family protein [Bacteroidota bacterium]
MSRTIVIEPTQNLVETIVARLGRETADWSDVAVVFPGRRPAHFVRKALGSLCGRSFIPPRFFSIDEFIDFVYRKAVPSPKNNLEPIDAIALLFEVHRGITDRLGESNFSSLDAFFPIGQKLFAELEELCIANLSLKTIREQLKPISFGRLNSLPDYYDRFYELVSEKGYATRSVRYNAVANQATNVDLPEFSSLIVAGFLALTKSEQEIFARLRQSPKATFIFQQGHGLRDHFDRLRITEDPGTPSGTEKAEIKLYEAQDTHGQVFALSHLLEEHIKERGHVTEKTVIVLPTADALFPLYHHTLPLLKQDEYNIALGYPLARTPIYGFLSSLMDLISAKQGDRIPAPAYLRYVLHPYAKNVQFEKRSEVTRILFHKVEELIAGDASKMFLTLDEIESLDEVFTAVPYGLHDDSITPDKLKAHLKHFHNETIRKFESFSSVGDFARKASEVLMFIFDRSTANLHPLFRVYAETMLTMFHEIELSLLNGQRFQHVEGYFNFLKRYVASQEVPFPGTPLKGLQVLGLLETRNIQFDDVFVLDVNDDVIPGGVGQEMMLPQGLREKLGLETYRSREHLVEYYFGLLLSGAKRVHLFYSETGKSEKSRFIEKILWDRQKRKGAVTAAKDALSIRYAMELSNPSPGPIEKTPAIVSRLRNSTFSASALDTYLKCPIRFYYANVLRLEEKDEVGDDVDQQEVGKFVHSALKKYFSGFAGRRLTEEVLEQQGLEKMAEQLFSEHFGSEGAGTLYLLKRQIVRQLAAFLVNYQIPRSRKNEIIIEDLELSIQIQHSHSRLEGRLDRIEVRGSNVFILDYKTGKDDAYLKINFRKLDAGNRETWPDAIGSLQLPFYLMLYAGKSGLPVERIHPAYIFLGRNSLDESIEVEFAEDPAERREHFRTIERVIDGLLQEIVSPDVPFQPTSDMQKNCPNCPFNVMCGTQWIHI